MTLNNRGRLVLALLFFVVILAGCARGAAETKVKLNEPFEMSIGQIVKVVDEDLGIRFEDVTEDSRCPRGVVCVWAGQATSVLEITAEGSQEKLTLTEPGLTDQAGKVTYKQYKFDSHLTPYPEAGKQITKKDYRLQLTISK